MGERLIRILFQSWRGYMLCASLGEANIIRKLPSRSRGSSCKYLAELFKPPCRILHVRQAVARQPARFAYNSRWHAQGAPTQPAQKQLLTIDASRDKKTAENVV